MFLFTKRIVLVALLSLGVGIEQGCWQSLSALESLFWSQGCVKLSTAQQQHPVPGWKLMERLMVDRKNRLKCVMPAICSGSSLLIPVLSSFLFFLSQHLKTCCWKRKICSVLMPISLLNDLSSLDGSCKKSLSGWKTWHFGISTLSFWKCWFASNQKLEGVGVVERA